MSELKARHIVDVYDYYAEQPCEERSQVYIKLEADKVIADLEESHKKEVGQLLIEIVCLKKQYKDMDVTHTVHIAKMNAKIEEQESVIAEKYTKIIQLEALIKNYDRISREIIDNANHQKYKRCLEMAKWCHNQREIYQRDSYNWELEDAAVDSLRNKTNIMRKWSKRWMELAEQFKESK